MKALGATMTFSALFLFGCGHGEHSPESDSPETPSLQSAGENAPSAAGLNVSQERTVEVACASCIYHMPGVEGCKLAATIDGKPMLVTGASVDAHELGLCSKPKEAVVVGKVDGDSFVATKVEVN